MTSSKRRVLRVVLAALFVGAGTLHFLFPDFYLGIMPPYLPWHLGLVYLSGFFEIVGGVGMVVPKLRRAAGWGLIALLIAVFPANLHMARQAWVAEGWSPWFVAMLLRLPLQLVFVAWVAYCMREDNGSRAGTGCATRDIDTTPHGSDEPDAHNER